MQEMRKDVSFKSILDQPGRIKMWPFLFVQLSVSVLPVSRRKVDNVALNALSEDSKLTVGKSAKTGASCDLSPTIVSSQYLQLVIRSINE